MSSSDEALSDRFPLLARSCLVDVVGKRPPQPV